MDYDEILTQFDSLIDSTGELIAGMRDAGCDENAILSNLIGSFLVNAGVADPLAGSFSSALAMYRLTYMRKRITDLENQIIMLRDDIIRLLPS